MIPPKFGRPFGLLRWLVLFLVVLGGAATFWYHQQRQGLICSAEAQSSWSLTYADGDNVSKFMWTIKPASQDLFLDCLRDQGYEVKTVPSSDEITAYDSYGRTISNSVGDDYVQKGRFYRW